MVRRHQTITLDIVLTQMVRSSRTMPEEAKAL
jgi:hypothetical protein